MPGYPLHSGDPSVSVPHPISVVVFPLILHSYHLCSLFLIMNVFLAFYYIVFVFLFFVSSGR